MERVIAYIDGYNLYYGMREAYGRRYHWLDVRKLSASLLRPGQELSEVRYFTARVSDPPDSQRRQSTYLEALEAHAGVKPVYGRLQLNEQTCRQCGHTYKKPEEKKTDVAIASHMVRDAYENACDVASLISADSDLVPPVEVVNGVLGCRSIVVFPPHRQSKHLAQAAPHMSLSEARLRQAQLPPVVVLPGGHELTRPRYWGPRER